VLANGFPHHQLFKFAQKKQQWNALVAATTLNAPPELTRQSAVLQASWGIYVKLEPARGAMTHEGKVLVQSNGTIEVTDRHGAVHSIDDATQAAYLRFISMLIAELVGLDAPNAHRERLREHDLGRLQHLHNVSGFSTRGLVFDHVTIRVPVKEALSLSPFAAEIDFAKFDALTRSARSDPASVVYGLDVVAEMSDRTLVWRFAPGCAPQGRVTLSETDPRFLAVLSITGS